MRLLLETHAFLWSWSGDRKLSMPQVDRGKCSSVLQACEIIIKLALSKLRFEGSMGDAIEKCDFLELPIHAHHAEAVLELPPHHSDPYDRMLIAQARVEGLTIVTHDRAFGAYPVPIALT